MSRRKQKPRVFSIFYAEELQTKISIPTESIEIVGQTSGLAAYRPVFCQSFFVVMVDSANLDAPENIRSDNTPDE